MGCGADSVLVDSLDHLYPSRNRVRCRFSWETPGDTLAVRAEAVAVTHLDTLLGSVDEAPWRPVESCFGWPLHPGVNTLAIRTRNRLGAEGYPFRIAIHRRG